MSIVNNNCSCSGYDLVGVSASLSAFISKNSSLDDLVILAALFTTIGDNLALIATSRAACESID